VLLPAALLALAFAASAERAWPPASPLLPPDHWAVRAVDRLETLGLAPDWLPAQRAAPLWSVGNALSTAADLAEQDDSPWAPLARGWADRFAAEFPRALGSDGLDDPDDAPRIAGLTVTAGAQVGRVHEDAPAPTAVALTAPPSGLTLGATGAALLGDHLAAGARLFVNGSDAHVDALELSGALGPLILSLGRGPVGYGPNQIGAVVASGNAAIDRIELLTSTPIHLPGPLAFLGDLAFDTALARFSEPRHPYTPLLWEFQVLLRPHPRLTLGGSRGTMFGGANWEGIPARDIPLSLLGLKNFRENNVYALSARWRLPSEPLLPLTARIDWGTDDNPGAWVQWPGLVAGLSSPGLPNLPIALGLEVASFGRGPFGYHDPFGWYSHGQYTGGWVTGQTPLGDPLGGNGQAYRLTGEAYLLDARLRLAASTALQHRSLDNLYAPAAIGWSFGAHAEAELRLGCWLAAVTGDMERGTSGWSRVSFSVKAGASL
jgi:hypothetical protein